MSSARIKSVFVKTSASENDDKDVLGYELQKTKDDYDSPIIIRQPEDRSIAGGHYTLVSSGGVFPDDVQATMKPYFDRAGYPHNFNSKTTDTVEEQEVRIMIELSKEEQYHVQKLDEDRYYVSHNNRPVNPPQVVVQEAQTVFLNYEPIL